MVPAPRFHTVRYAGVLAPASKLRPKIVPSGTCLEHARAWKEVVGERIADGAQAELVSGGGVFELLDGIEKAPTCGVGLVQPGK